MCYICPDAGPASPPPAPPPPPPPVITAAPAVSVGPSGGQLGFGNSAYGAMIPIVFGADRIQGNVIWASTPSLVTSNIKGVDTTYQVINFALALCEGSITGIMRIWAGTQLVLDNTIDTVFGSIVAPRPNGVIGAYTVDFTDPTGPLAGLDPSARGHTTRITVYNGSETQIAQGIMAAVEGYENTPAYRGTAVVMFEDFPIEQNAIPSLWFEVSSHVSADSPRQYSDFVGTTFNQLRFTTLAMDLSYNRFYTYATKTSPAAGGLVVTDANSLVELGQLEVEQYYSVGPNWDCLCVCQISGILVVSQQSGNNGILYTINPLSGGILDTVGPGGNLTGHGTTAPNGITEGLADLTSQGVISLSCPTLYSTSAPLQDIFVGVGSINQSVGVARIDGNGNITIVASLQGVVPYINNTIAHVNVDQNLYNRTEEIIFGTTHLITYPFRRMYDGVSSIGHWVFGFSYRNNETASIKVWRVCVWGFGALPETPVYLELASIPVDMFAGTGYAYEVRAALADQADQRIMLHIVSTAGTWICKYDPFTGKVIWSTRVSALPTSITSNHGPAFALIAGSYAWIDGSNKVQRINLATGVVTTIIDALSGESLPNMSDAKQYYNGLENTLTYLTATAGKRMTKIFLDRLARTTIDLSDIVVNLIERTGLLESDINVEDLSVLSLHGYTITNVQSIRQCFADLAQVFTYDVVESNGKLLYKTRGNGTDVTLSHDSLQIGQGGSASAGQDGGNENDWLKTHQLNDGSRIRKINLTYRDIDREYASSVQSVILSKYGSQAFDPEAAIDVQVPVVLDSNQARSLAEILLYAKLTYNTTYEFILKPAYMVLDPADVIQINMPGVEEPLVVRLREVTINSDNSVQCKASEENSDIYTDQIDLFGNVGRFVIPQVPQPPGRVDVLALTIPGRVNSEIGNKTTVHRLFFAFLNPVANSFLPNPISMTVDGVLYAVPPVYDNFATWGIVVQPPNTTKSYDSTDNDSTVIVDIFNMSTNIASAPGGKADLIANDGVNLCYIAGELFQFVTATQLTAVRWQFTELHRAKMGTEQYVGRARAGDQFVLLADETAAYDTQGVLAIECAIRSTRDKAVSIDLRTGNPFQSPYTNTVTALNLTPFRVSDFVMSYVATDAVMNWQRRSRTADGAYPDDGSVAPSEGVTLPEVSETYVLYLYKTAGALVTTNPSTYLRKVTVTTNTFTYTAAMQTADSFVRTADTLYVQIQETGSNTGFDDGIAETEKLVHV